MNRHMFSVALLIAAVGGGSAIAVPAQADEAPPLPKRSPPAKSKSETEAPPRKPCQTNGECPGDQICKPVGDHKECRPSPPRRPVPT